MSRRPGEVGVDTRGMLGSEVVATRPVTVNDVIGGHVALDLQCLDRIYLNGYVPNLQVGGEVVNFLTHRGFPILSGVAGETRAAVPAGGNRLRRGQRRPVGALRQRRPQVGCGAPASGPAGAGVPGPGWLRSGWPRSFKRVFSGTTVHAEGGGAPHFSYTKADRRVTAYYFYPGVAAADGQGPWLPAGEVVGRLRFRGQPQRQRRHHPHPVQLRMGAFRAPAVPDQGLGHRQVASCSSGWPPQRRRPGSG